MNWLSDILFSIGSFIGSLLKMILQWFQDLDFYDKLIVINTLTAFLAVILPVGKYYIFEAWFSINNPLAVYMILIVALMWVLIFKKFTFLYLAVVVISLCYMFYMIYLIFSHGFSHAPYNLSYGIFFNIAAPIVFCAISIMSMLRGYN
ncbi:MAG: hypothetical protein BWY23_00922 [Spirochaetes bacterium ADurb.Bin218]|jgi:hypothetical protein|nr:hypothetical protein [Spirochaetota bacterium]OQA98807.1 MAG: hypothetical protein BWY23_00922 [Spirochaetes bacterium ADurb.Bin218]HOQ11219.1 hypothetical protein [Spirochaetota bacterium]HOV09137.1 hypothetical protein [Spirochaetota bacterium]